MGNRAVIVSKDTNEGNAAEKVGIYVHWHGSESTIKEMLAECKRRGIRPVDYDSQYSWARICQCMADMISDEYGDSADKYSTGIGIGIVSQLDCANGDNGVYYIDGDWNIVKHTDGHEFSLPSADKVDRNSTGIDRISMEKFDDNFSDYWDSVRQQFIIYYGKAGDNYELSYNAKITDFDGKVWDCVLCDSEWDESAQCYKAFYEPKGE